MTARSLPRLAYRLLSAIPKLASLEIGRSLAFFERLGFARRFESATYGVAALDDVVLHFWLCTDARVPKETGCRIVVDGIEALFDTCAGLDIVHPNGPLATKPWGREFSILDVDGNLVTFQAPPVPSRPTPPPRLEG